jgi:hypothetical protein
VLDVLVGSLKQVRSLIDGRARQLVEEDGFGG